MKLAERMSFGSDTSFECAEDGTYTCTLQEIEVKAFPSFEDPTLMEDKFVFKYETVDAADSKGNPFKFFEFIRVVKSLTDTSNLAKRLDQMLGYRMTREQFAEFDTDELVGKMWRVTVVADAKGRNKIMAVKTRQTGRNAVRLDSPVPPPRRETAPPPPLQDVDDDPEMEDPFKER